MTVVCGKNIWKYLASVIMNGFPKKNLFEIGMLPRSNFLSRLCKKVRQLVFCIKISVNLV